MKSLLILIIVSFINIFSQDKFIKVIDEKSEKEILVGECDYKVFADSNYSWWFDYEYNNYKPDSLTIEQIKKLNHNFDIVIIMGTWCSDSRREVPRFLKILEQIIYDKDKINIICVDRNKLSYNLDVSKYGIKYVPTFIFEKNGFELGRIVETPTETLEKDLLDILLKE